MKKKLALLLAVVMILSMLPVNLLANDAPPIVTPPLGRVWTGLHRVSTAATEPVHTHMHIDMRDLQIHRQALAADDTFGVGQWLSPQALNFNVSLQGAGTGYLRFPDDSRVMWPWTYGSPQNPTGIGSRTAPSGYVHDIRWPIFVNADDLRSISAPLGVGDGRVWSAYFTRTGYQTGIITVYHTGDLLPVDTVGNLRFDLPLGRVRANNTTMTAFFHGGGILAHGPLLGLAATGITISDPDTVGFEWVANLNRLSIQENAVSELTRHVGPNRAFAVRLTAPAGYFWGTPHNSAVGPRSNPDAATLGNASYRAVYWSPNVFGVHDSPTLSSPNNILVFDRVARYTYSDTPGNRQELLIIVENLRRNPTSVGNAAGRLDINGLVLIPGENAPRTGNVNIDVHIGTVSTVRSHVARTHGDPARWYCYAGFAWGAHVANTNNPPHIGGPGHTAGNGIWNVRWTNEVPWRSDRILNRMNQNYFNWTDSDEVWQDYWHREWNVLPPSTLTRAQVEAQRSRSRTEPNGTCHLDIGWYNAAGNWVAVSNFAMGWIPYILGGHLGPVASGADNNVVCTGVCPGCPGCQPGPGAGGLQPPSPPALQTPPGPGVQGNVCVVGEVVDVGNVWRLDWRQIQDRVTRHVATRLTAALELDIYGDLPYLRSGSVNTDYAQAYVTGTTARLLVRENVPSALHLGLGAPITFTFPEGVEIMSFRYRMMPYDHSGNWNWRGGNAEPRTNWIMPLADGAPITHGGEVTRFTGNSLTLSRNIQTPLNPRTRTMQVEFRLAVEGGYAWKNGDTIDVTVTGGAVSANLGEADNTIAVAYVYDPVIVEFSELPIVVPHDFLEQNINHEYIGDITITETAGNRLSIGDEIWIYVHRTYIQRAWDIILTNGGVVHDDSGLTVTVEPHHREIPGLLTQFHGLRVTVTGISDIDTPGTVRLTGNHVFGHVYPGEEYHIVVTGPAIARNHNLVSAALTPFTGGTVPLATQLANRRGIFASLPYFEELIDSMGEVEQPRPDRPSLAGVTIRVGVAIGEVASPLYFEPVPGTSLVAGFVSARAFAIISGFENIHWNGAARVATLSGFDAAGVWTTIRMSPAETNVSVTRGGDTTEFDIAFVAGDSGPVGTIRPIHRNNRLYLPLRFMFNVLGFDRYYEITGGPSVQSVTFVAR